VKVEALILVVVLVESQYTLAEAGRPIMRLVQPFYPTLPLMLVSLEKNGYRAWADFETHKLLVLVQNKNLNFEEVDTDFPPEEELPF
jgi:hypothetical protein